MKKAIGIAVFSMLFPARTGLAAEKTSDKPDPEMLRMMEYLKDWEMLKNMDLLKEMQRIGRDTNSAGTAQNSLPPKQKETVK